MDLLAFEGDGIGPEITATTVAVIKSVRQRYGQPLRLTRTEISLSALKRLGSTLPAEVIAAAKTAAGLVLGPVPHNAFPPVTVSGLSPSGVLRHEQGPCANIRPARSRRALPRPVAARHLLRDLTRFDVIPATNMFGHIPSHLETRTPDPDGAHDPAAFGARLATMIKES